MFIAINVIDPGRGKCNNYGPSVLRLNNIIYNVSNIVVVLTLKIDVSHFFFYIGSGVIISSCL